MRIFLLSLLSCTISLHLIANHGGAGSSASQAISSSSSSEASVYEELQSQQQLNETSAAPSKADLKKEIISMIKAQRSNHKAQKEKLSKAERKEMRQQVKVQFKEIKSQIKAIKNNQKNSEQQNDERFLIALILCFLIPPLGVYIYENEISSNFWISLLLTFLFFFPGVVFSILVVAGVI